MWGRGGGTIVRTSHWTRLLAVSVVVIVSVISTLSLQVILVNIVDSLVVVGTWRVLGDDVPRVDQAREVSENTKKDVDERIGSTDTTADPHRKRREKHGNHDKKNVRKTFTAHFGKKIV